MPLAAASHPVELADPVAPLLVRLDAISPVVRVRLQRSLPHVFVSALQAIYLAAAYQQVLFLSLEAALVR